MEIDESRIERAEELMHQYLVVAKDLYKGAKIQPNHHLALHLGVFLRLFGKGGREIGNGRVQFPRSPSCVSAGKE